LLKKPFQGLFQPVKRKVLFSLYFIFQAHKPCLKNGGTSVYRTQAVENEIFNSLLEPPKYSATAAGIFIQGVPAIHHRKSLLYIKWMDYGYT
jgi:hypothetical protein